MGVLTTKFALVFDGWYNAGTYAVEQYLKYSFNKFDGHGATCVEFESLLNEKDPSAEANVDLSSTVYQFLAINLVMVFQLLPITVKISNTFSVYMAVCLLNLFAKGSTWL